MCSSSSQWQVGCNTTASLSKEMSITEPMRHMQVYNAHSRVFNISSHLCCPSVTRNKAGVSSPTYNWCPSQLPMEMIHFSFWQMVHLQNFKYNNFLWCWFCQLKNITLSPRLFFFSKLQNFVPLTYVQKRGPFLFFCIFQYYGYKAYFQCS